MTSVISSSTGAKAATEQQISAIVDELLNSVTEIKISLEDLIRKLEYAEHNNFNEFASILDSFSITSGQMSLLFKRLKDTEDRYKMLNNIVVFPKTLSMEKDPRLGILTENRAQVFDHDLAPLYLRTKLTPALESKRKVLADMSVVDEEQDKELFKHHDWCNAELSKAIDYIQNFTDKFEDSINARNVSRSRSDGALSNDITERLLGAAIYGKGLRDNSDTIGGGGGQGQVTSQNQFILQQQLAQQAANNAAATAAAENASIQKQQRQTIVNPIIRTTFG